MQRSNIVTNILLTIIALAIIILIVVLIKNKKDITPVNNVPIIFDSDKPTNSVYNPVAAPTSSSGYKEPVHPPAPGTFDSSAVTGFGSSYDKETRSFSIVAYVKNYMFFEGNTIVSLYDQEGNLIQSKGVQASGSVDYTLATQPLPISFSFVLPASKDPKQSFIVRITQEDVSGLGKVKYWGTVISGRE